MNLIKATIATAAVVTCCLGNSYPAHANNYCDALVDAYIEIRGEIMSMQLSSELEAAADDDAYNAYMANARAANCTVF